MSETQGYKKTTEFTVPAGGVDIAHALFTERLNDLTAVMDDPEAENYFSPQEWTAMGFERLMLAQMVARMNKGGADA
jgi:hypothetical protein